MPPTVKISKQDIVNTGIALIRESGVQAINARSIATALGCSTQPIFSNFATMDALGKAIRLAAYELYLGFLEKERAQAIYPPYKAMGMAYIRFAAQERELFKLLFMCDRTSEEKGMSADYSMAVDIIRRRNGLTQEQAELLHLEMWACVHGIATMFATSFLSLDWELVSHMLTDVYLGVRARHAGEGEK